MIYSKTVSDLNTSFEAMIKANTSELFLLHKQDLLNILGLITFKNKNSLDAQIATFNLTCDNYLESNFNIEFKKLLFGDFEMFLTTVGEGSFD